MIRSDRDRRRGAPLPALLLALAACAPKASRIDALAEAGWLGDACQLATERGEVPAGLAAAHLRDAPTLRMTTETGPPFADVPSYGVDWKIVRLQADLPGDVASPAGVLEVAEDGWDACPSCDSAWIAYELAHSGNTNLLADLLDGLGGLMKVGAAVITLPGAIGVDIALSPLSILGPKRYAEHSVTAQLLDRIFAPAPHPPYRADCRSDAPCGAVVVGRRGHGAASDERVVAWTWVHEGCGLTATWDVRAGDAPIDLSALEPVAWGVRAVAR